MSLQIDPIEYTIKIISIALSGRLDAFASPALRKVCDKFIEDGIIHIVFDLGNVTMIDSAGLAVLISALKKTRLGGGDVRIIWPQVEAAARILKLTKFDQVFTSIEASQIIPKGF
ncbi:MAG: STAS domain-containing protein [Chloroflexi bacterium]|nr:STAS domain-containing protein [Chloroflexota bacterium]